ncbi:MAG: hypothetical protein Q9173_004135 [Seirophora scorigena]
MQQALIMHINSVHPCPCKCSECGHVFKNESTLKDHQKAQGHGDCQYCKSFFPSQSDLVLHQKAERHYRCGHCEDVFHLLTELRTHQRATSHLFCGQCCEFFCDWKAQANHMRLITHVTEFRCLECEEDFVDEKALTRHLADEDSHSGPLRGPARTFLHFSPQQPLTEAPIRPAASDIRRLTDGYYQCTKCNRRFVRQEDAEQHATSIIHNPLVNLKCIASPACSAKFTSLSALISHLESGSCRASRERPKTEWLIQQDGQAKLIILGTLNTTMSSKAVTNQTTASSLTSSEDLVRHLDSRPAVQIAPSNSTNRSSSSQPAERTGSETGNSSPNASTTPSSTELSTVKPTANEPDRNSSNQIVLSKASQLATTPAAIIEADSPPPNLMPPLVPTRRSTTKPASIPCPHCFPSSKPFPTITALHDHLRSYKHWPKVFRCPDDLVISGITGRGRTLSRQALGRDFLGTLKAVKGHMERSGVRREELEGVVEFVYEKLREMGFEGFRFGE